MLTDCEVRGGQNFDILSDILFELPLNFANQRTLYLSMYGPLM